MINNIITGISMALNSEFGDTCKVYPEAVKQGMPPPCFFINVLNPSSTRIHGNRFFRKQLFCIQFFPETDQPREECYQVAEQLYGCLEYITANGDLTMGTRMHYEVTDYGLSFFVNYDFYVREISEQDPEMETATEEVTVKKGDE
jgi:hypothetical protein